MKLSSADSYAVDMYVHLCMFILTVLLQVIQAAWNLSQRWQKECATHDGSALSARSVLTVGNQALMWVFPHFECHFSVPWSLCLVLASSQGGNLNMPPVRMEIWTCLQSWWQYEHASSQDGNLNMPPVRMEIWTCLVKVEIWTCLQLGWKFEQACCLAGRFDGCEPWR